MQNNKNNESLQNPSNMTGPHRGMQGIDKAPGSEEHEGTNEKIVEQTQKGKGKVDGDPAQKSDQPISNE